MAEDEQLKMRFSELAERAERNACYTETKFLNQAEQSVLLSLRTAAPYMLTGGYEGAERRVAVFGSEDETGYPYEEDIACILIEPVNPRFADELTHRDYLGSVMALGITREMLGDIIVTEGGGYLFCLRTIAEHIMNSLSEIKHTTVKCALSAPPEECAAEPPHISFVVSSERLDAVIAAVYRISRESAKNLCEKGLVFVNSREAAKGGAQIPENAIVSVRGKGRFRFIGVSRETKKGRLRVEAAVWQ